MRTGSVPFRPSGLSSQPAQPESADYLALEKGRLVVITPATPQTKRGLLGALVGPRSDSKGLSSQSASPSTSKSRTSGASSPGSSQSRSSAPEPTVSPLSGDEQVNRSLLTALTSYASKLKLPADATFHEDIGLLQRECAVLPPQEFGHSALKIYAAAKAQAEEAPIGVDQVVATAVREARDRVMAGGAAFTVFADTIQTAEVLKAFGCHLECHQGRLVVLHSMEGLSPDEVRLARRLDAKILMGGASLTTEEQVLQSRRSGNGKAFMQRTYGPGESLEEGLFATPQGPIPLEDVTANRAANEPVLEAVTERLKEAGIGPALIAQLKESMKPVLERSPELFAYRLASRTKSWDARVGMARLELAAHGFDQISRRLEHHMKSGSLVNAEAHMLPRYAQRAFAISLDQEMGLQPEMNRRKDKQKSLPAGQTLAPLAMMSMDELTDLAIMELRRAELKPLSGKLPPLPPPLPPELAAKHARTDTK